MENTPYLNEKDVLSVDKDQHGWVVISDSTFKVEAFLERIKSYLQGNEKPKKELFEKGINVRCCALVLTGKRVKLESV